MARLKKLDPDVYPQEVLADEEPRYLRRQKPVEIRRRKFGKKAWKSYTRVFLWIVVALLAAGSLYATGNFLLTSPEMALASPAQVDLSGNHYVTRASVLEIFAADRGLSVLRIPLAERRAQIEALPWVLRAAVRRALPNRIQVDIVERTPIAFLREGSNLFLIDAQGKILDRPLTGDFQFPVVTGISSVMPADARAARMQVFASFMDQVRGLSANAADSVSEVDLSDPTDLRATVIGLPGMSAAGGANSGGDAVLVHFGNSNFADKFQVLMNNIAQWEAAAGRVASVDLRFQKEVVVNPETLPSASAAGVSAAPGASGSAPKISSRAPRRVHR